MFTDEEAKVYDRQIRLWGIHAQQQIRATDIFLVGLDGLATEIVKNLVLTGINSITMLDDQLVTEFDMLSNLFTRNQIGMNRAEACQKAVLELNPMVKVSIKSDSLASLLSDGNKAKELIKSFHVVVLVNHSLTLAIKLNKICNELNIPFFFACAWGYLSMVFLDLGRNFNGVDFVSLEQAFEKKNLTFKSNAHKKLSKRDAMKIAGLKSIFVPILVLFRYHSQNGKFPMLLNESDRFELNENLKTIEKEILHELTNCEANEDQHWTSLKDWHSKICGQFTFISSIVGGFLAQEVIRTVTKDIIDYNLFLFYEINGHNINIGL